MTTHQDLTGIMRDAADLIDRDGWVQGQMGDACQGYCEHGAIMACTPRKGDAHLVRAVMRARGYDEDWNDETGRTAEEVAAVLRGASVTDEDLDAAFGPQWAAIVALVRRAAALAEDESRQLRAAWRATWGAARSAAWDATQGAAWEAAWGAARSAARNAAWDATQGAAWDVTEDATWDAASALVVRDLIGQHGFTQEHYDTLTGPWRRVIGPVHPDDAPLSTTEGETK